MLPVDRIAFPENLGRSGTESIAGESAAGADRRQRRADAGAFLTTTHADGPSLMKH